MSVSTVTKSTVVVTPEASKPLIQDEARALFALIEAFRPDWADWKAVMGKLQQASIAGMDGHKVVGYVITAAATEPDRKWADLDILGDCNA